MPPFKLAPLLAATMLFPVLAEEAIPELDTVTVTDTIVINPNVARPGEYTQSRGDNADGGAFLGQFNGVSTSRFGGRGLEPVIRGQSQTRLNVLLDGAYVHGGCPNRMDPPSSWAALETYEEVTVLKGVQSVIHGGGGSGGTVLFQRDSRGLAEESEGLLGRVSFTASSNGTQGDLLADVLAAGAQGYVRALGQVKKVEDYEDGDGREVRSAFDHLQGGFIAGWTPTADRLLEFGYERNEFEDALYPGAAMDSPEESGNIFRLRYLDAPGLSWMKTVKAEVYRADVDHVMDNFSLRTPPKYTAPPAMVGQDMLRRTTTTSDTTGGRLEIQTDTRQASWTYGLDVQINQRDASLDNLDSGEPQAISLMWPDAEIRQTGIFAETTWFLDEKQRLKTGLRLDQVSASADKADAKPAAGPKTANQVYQMYYGHTAEDQDETNLGALLRFERDLNENLNFAAGLSRSVRTADASERFMNKWGMTGAQRWVGNPAIQPEKHHQLDIGLHWRNARSNLGAVVFFDKVGDYILRDAARGQDGVLLADNADIYRNVDAELRGVELDGRVRVTTKLELSAALAYVHATNTSDDRPIAQTPPLNGQLQADFREKAWGLGGRLRFARGQDRVDDLSKQEVGETSGFGVVDLYGHYHPNDWLQLRLGVDNLFDRAYAQHLNRANLMDSEAFKVNEPGRSIWLKLGAEF